LETIAAIGPAMPAAVAAAAATTTHAGGKDDDHPSSSDDDVHVRFGQILHVWETLAVTHPLHYDPVDPSPPTLTTNGRRFPQPVSDAFLDTLIAHDAHDVLRNDPPRPPVSSEADRGRRWYEARRGGTTGVLRAAEPVYFALRPGGGGGGGAGTRGADGEKEYCLSAAPWWVVAHTSYQMAADALTRGSDVGEDAFGRRVARACAEKRFFMTDKGSMGLASAGARVGGVLAFFPTGQFPMVLRPCGGQEETGGGNDAGRYTCRLVGEGFLYDWWRHPLPVFEHRNKGLAYPHLLTEFAIQ
jgi:hypothetical protein